MHVTVVLGTARMWQVLQPQVQPVLPCLSAPSQSSADFELACCSEQCVGHWRSGRSSSRFGRQRDPGEPVYGSHHPV